MKLQLLLLSVVSLCLETTASAQENFSQLRSKGVLIESLTNLQRFNIDYTIEDIDPSTEDSLLLIQLPLESYEHLRSLDEDKEVWCNTVNRELILFSVNKTMDNIELNQIRISRSEGRRNESFNLE